MSPRGYNLPARRLDPIEPAHMELAHRVIDPSKPGDRRYLMDVTALGRAASEESWTNYDRIGEIRYAISRSARIAGYASIGAVRVDRTGKPTKADSKVVDSIVQSIYGRFGGTRGLIERYYALMKITGEAWLTAFSEPNPLADGARETDGYWFLSSSEIVNDSGDMPTEGSAVRWRTARKTTASGERAWTEREIPAADFKGRLWLPHHRFVDEPSTPMTAINAWADMLHTLTMSIESRLRQRFKMAGILLIPSEINDAAISADIMPSHNAYGTTDKVLNYLIHIMTMNSVRRGAAIDDMPILLKGPADVLDKVRHMVIEPTIAETDLKLRAELIGRILDSLDQQRGAVEGMAAQNHWTAWLVSDEERRITVTPDLHQMCFGLTRMILWAELKARGWEPARIWPWRLSFDLSEASVRSNTSEDFRQAYDRFGISPAALRRSSGATELDAPTSPELVRMFGNKYGDPYLAFYGLDDITIDYTKVGALKKSGPNADSTAEPGEVGPGAGDPGSPNDRDSDTPKTEEPG